MILYLVVAFVVLVAIFLMIAARQPDVLRVQRSIVIAAPASASFDEVNNFHRWRAWSPFVELDPAMKTTYNGPAEGEGAIMAWSGNRKAGQGSMIILESELDELVRIQLEFTRPFPSTNTAEFTFKSQGNQTLVTWTMLCPSNFMLKLMRTLMNMDTMIGRDFVLGLARMKTLVETKFNT